jgi:hypothetical protein
MIVAEQSTEALPPHHWTRVATHCSLRRDASVVETLMIALGMIVGEVLVDHMIQGACTQHDHPFHSLLLARAYKPFAVRIQIGTPGRQDNGVYPAVLEEGIKRLRKFRVPVVEQRAFAQ